MGADELLRAMREGAFDGKLRAVYGGAVPMGEVYDRIASVVEGFCALYDPQRRRALSVFSAPGRTELGGNHTDHQGGWGLAGSADMDTLACVALSPGPIIRVKSRGHDPAEIDVSDKSLRQEERSRSQALLRGIAARLGELGYPVGGFDAYTETRVLRASGLSSSAAFEVLIAQIMNQLFCGGALDATALAKVGRYAENVYYGKPCGLLDQLACATGGVIAVDFTDENDPAIRNCTVDFAGAGYALVVVDSGANHSELDGAFAAITEEMAAVARFFGASRLRDVEEGAFFAQRDRVARRLGLRPALRAEHFFQESRRAAEQYEALSRGDYPRFLALVRESGQSSEEKLQNVSLDRPDGDRLLRVVRLARELAGPRGAARVHGGGFAGTAQAYVPLDRLDAFIAGMEGALGPGRCHIIRIRDTGSLRLI